MQKQLDGSLLDEFIEYSRQLSPTLIKYKPIETSSTQSNCQSVDRRVYTRAQTFKPTVLL